MSSARHLASAGEQRELGQRTGYHWKFEPVHVFPVRIIVPGQIGGRSVKLHFWVVPDQAPAEKWHWWYGPRYVITLSFGELNINSVIAKLDHHDNEKDENGTITSYPIRRYTYAGGGRRATRVEVLLDQGGTWTMGNMIATSMDEGPTLQQGDV
ncbi:uncharacterized protein F5147DRAFT_787090 [Suillus discolor]|uniref:Moybdenum cofactor oxidoreductase dimerisation domain-containing protein n=1 Tax=Suillus discolor TaxID=1912936 RepID=A0A9P7JMJ9_9AGAM|nr:uncharacterized protein F5147DRAFT_787090 [Suillus discolor]KAG2090771.1 hypothetical protein F5147DRAFT_787090 [Suillus discolor]